MKLSTMTLPTGEFILVVTGMKPIDQSQSAAWRQFKDDIGAAGVVLLRDTDVELVNAVDPAECEVIRAEEPDTIPPILVDEAADFIEEYAKQHRDVVPEPTFTDYLTKRGEDADEVMRRQLNTGVKFSPAGLPIGLYSQARLEPELVHALHGLPGEPRASGRLPDRHILEPEKLVIDDEDWPSDDNFKTPEPADPPAAPDLREALLAAKKNLDEWGQPDPLAPGTRVEITGPPLWRHNNDVRGQIAYVQCDQSAPEGTRLVGPLNCDDYTDCRWYFPTSSLQPLPADLEGMMESDEETEEDNDG